GVPQLVVAGHAARDAVLDGAPDAHEVAVEPIDAASPDAQPRTAVDPRAPRPELGHRVRPAALVELSREHPERLDGERALGVIVDAEIHVGVLVGVRT